MGEKLDLVEFTGEIIVERMNETQLLIGLFGSFVQIGQQTLFQCTQLFIIHGQNDLILHERPVIIAGIMDCSICRRFRTCEIHRLIVIVDIAVVVVIVLVVFGDRGYVMIVI